MEDYGISEKKFNPVKEMARFFALYSLTNSVIMGVCLYSIGVAETRSLNPFPIYQNYQKISEQKVMEIKMRDKSPGNLENMISIRDLYRVD